MVKRKNVIVVNSKKKAAKLRQLIRSAIRRKLSHY